MEAGMVLGVVALVVLCCLGVTVLGLFAPSPVPVAPMPWPSAT